MLTEEQLKQIAVNLIGTIAPEADIDHLDPTERFRNQFDFDSVDFMNFVTGLQEQLKINIPEQDYPRLATLTGCITYVKALVSP